ncbi:hypothetical protein HUN01_11830 [Nostoc edaphicum CCNP1411]|uniref:DUF4126 domain-containing protein n=2 Tax=Nostoc TaxID=1177 RepID=A0A7D7LBT2_9NOSO|nr:hypothetical protein HUN01_11830 [Nostoc edaphicum CCNP1411]
MFMTLISAFLLGLVAGLRALTAPAALFLARGGIIGIVLAVLAVAEFIGDMLPQIPSRTSPPALIARILSGGIVGWLVTGANSSFAFVGALFGIVGALVGAYGGRAVRIAAIERIGAVPAALAEDVVAIALAAFIVTR